MNLHVVKMNPSSSSLKEVDYLALSETSHVGVMLLVHLKILLVEFFEVFHSQDEIEFRLFLIYS